MHMGTYIRGPCNISMSVYQLHNYAKIEHFKMKLERLETLVYYASGLANWQTFPPKILLLGNN